MMRTGRWTEVEAREVLRAWRKSGTTISEFARRRGLVPERLYHWRNKLGVEEDVEMVAVSVVEPAARPRGEPVLVLLRSGHMLKLVRGFDEEALERAVAVLDPC